MPDTVNLLERTDSLCPVCLDRIEATIVERDGKVFLEKSCPEHGAMKVPLWPDADHYRWFRAFQLTSGKPSPLTHTRRGCPRDCGPCPEHRKHATLAEIEVTQRCNLRCPVCFMAADDGTDDPSLEAIDEMFAAIASNSGPQTSVQITGGEPTVRPDLPEIVALGRARGFSGIEINSNGLVLARSPHLLRRLADAGLSGVYLQFDGLRDDVYRQIRGRELLADKLGAIEHCRAAGVQVVLAMTVVDGVNDDQIGVVLDFALENKEVVVGLALQPAFASGRFEVELPRRLTMGDVVFALAAQSDGRIGPYDLWPLGCSHPLCSCATLLVDDGQTTLPVTRMITPEDYRARFDPCSPQGSVFPDILAQMERDTHGLSIVVMNYMDAWSMDLNRLRECSMIVATGAGRLVPFCAYQLTGASGRRLYPGEGVE